MSKGYAYFKFERLPEQVRAAHNIKSKQRLDCTEFCDETSGYSGLEPLLTHKKQMYLYLTPARDIVNADAQRTSEWSLTKGSLNFSSMYAEDLDYPELSYGYPNSKRTLSNGTENPFYPYRHDGYLFIMNQDITELEILVIPESRNLISSHFQLLIDGELEADLSRLRQNAKPFFDYWSIVI